MTEVSFNWSSIIHSVTFYHKVGEGLIIFGDQIEWSNAPLFPACQVLDLLKYVDCGNTSCTPTEIIFYTSSDLYNLGVSISLEERNKVQSRTFKLNTLSYEGPLIRNKDLSNSVSVKTIFRLEQTLDSEEDEKKKCKNYPTEEFESYDDCDRSFIRNKMKNEFNITPFWTTDNLEEVTKIGVYDSDEVSLYDYYDGTAVSPCLVPCLTTKVLDLRIKE